MGRRMSMDYFSDHDFLAPYRGREHTDRRVLLNVQERAAMGFNEIDVDEPGEFLGIDRQEFD